MNVAAVSAIARAVLYEGFILYPYRPSAVKNRQRWTFGGLFPQPYAERHGEASSQQVECLIEGSDATRVEIVLRFLHLTSRQVERLDGADFVPVERIDVDGDSYISWQEAVERALPTPLLRLGDLVEQAWAMPFLIDPSLGEETLRAADGAQIGRLRRTRLALEGCLTARAQRLDAGVYRLQVRSENLSAPVAEADIGRDRDRAAMASFASTHHILGLEEGAFVSLIDPPADLAAAAGECRNRGCFPVLAGAPGERQLMLASPIILYDYPQIAPESPGDLFDATEIDEVLSLRILAMTDAEKREMTAADPGARAILERTEQLDGDAMLQLHGRIRQMRPLPASAPAGRRLGVGDRVRLHPRAGGDVFDLVLDGRTAVIESIERDYEDRVHVAVALDCDPGRDFGLDRLPGHRFFFSPEEIEGLATATESERGDVP